MKFSEVITIDKTVAHARGQFQKSKVKVTEVKTQFSRLQTPITPVLIHMWMRNDSQSSSSIEEGYMDKQINDLNPILS